EPDAGTAHAPVDVRRSSTGGVVRTGRADVGTWVCAGRTTGATSARVGSMRSTRQVTTGGAATSPDMTARPTTVDRHKATRQRGFRPAIAAWAAQARASKAV